MTPFSDVAMTVPYRILVGKELTFSERKNVQQIINDTFEEVNAIYNYWNPNSEVSRLNRLKKNEKVEISSQLENFLQMTDKIVEVTEGRFDPTIGALQKLWRKHLEQGTIPDVLLSVGWDKIHFSNGIFWKDSDDISLDLGGVAKGYCVDLITERLNAAGFPDVYVEWGGEIRASGRHPQGRPWRVFITNLADSNPDHALAIVELNNQAIATSGDYLQFWKVNETIYFHIIDPRTGIPLVATENSIASASVLAPTCAFADGLATALMIPGDNTKLDVTYWLSSKTVTDLEHFEHGR